MNYKIYRGGKEYVWYNSGVIHLDAGGKTRKIDAVYIRKSVTCLFLVWHRSIYSIKKNNIYEMVKAIMCYSLS